MIIGRFKVRCRTSPRTCSGGSVTPALTSSPRSCRPGTRSSTPRR